MRRVAVTAPATKRRRRGEGTLERDEASATCPICYEAFDARERTVTHAFRCGGQPHGICRVCDASMFQRHDDACPICRAERTVESMRANGPRAPRRMSFAGPNGTIFFPVDEDVGSSVPIVEVRVFHAGGGMSQQNGGSRSSVASSVINDVLNDPVFQAAIDGLRNPVNVNVTTFLANLGEARRSRRERAVTDHVPRPETGDGE